MEAFMAILGEIAKLKLMLHNAYVVNAIPIHLIIIIGTH